MYICVLLLNFLMYNFAPVKLYTYKVAVTKLDNLQVYSVHSYFGPMAIVEILAKSCHHTCGHWTEAVCMDNPANWT